MGKGKTTKRERKFAAKGGVKARLDKGGTIAPKGKVKRKRRTSTADPEGNAIKKAKRDQKNSDDYIQQKKAQRDAEDFVGRENLGELDVGKFFANFEDDLKQEGSSSSDSEDEDQSDSEEEKGVKASSKKQKKDESESGSDDSSEEEEEESPKKSSKTKKEDHSDSDDSDDEDVEAAEAKMKAQMKKLQKQDPEFHEFLQENEEALLQFGKEEPERINMDVDDEEDEDDEKGGSTVVLTPKVLRNIEHGAFRDHGIKSLKKIVKAYQSACHVASPSGDENEDENKRSGKSYHIEDPQIFDQLMVMCLDRCHDEFHLHLLASDDERANALKKNNKTDKKKGSSNSDKETNEKPPSKDSQEMNVDEEGGEEDSDVKPLDPKVLEKSPRWVDVKPILNMFLKATLHIISESKEPDLVAIVLKAMSKYLRYMTPFPRIAESSLRILTDLWSAPLGDSSAEYQVVRLNAFLRIRQLALTQPFPFIEDCLKKTYLAYARRAKFGGASSISSNTLPTLTFMGNCLVELYSLDYHSSYQHAFVYIRQLALFLRTAMQKKTPEAFQNVYCWQYIHCLKLWVAVLAGSCKPSNHLGEGADQQQQQLLRSLVFPLTEVILGTIRLAPAPARHIPLRFHCVRLLQQLAAATETYIPTSSILLEALDMKEFNMKPKKIKTKGGGVTTRGVQLPFVLKLAKEDPLRTTEEQEACITELFKLLNREVDLYRYSAGFPEFSIQLVQRLKKVRDF
mgnify:CR=1 FL=1